MSSSTVRTIAASGLSIYDSIEGLPELYIENSSLETILGNALQGLNLNYPIRTRSKVLKSKVCEALGYPVPKSFRKTRPRFPGQNFDTYVQKANNLQIWNEEVSPGRRYVLVRIDKDHLVTKVRVVTGEVLAKYDSTGTLTQKYQAKSQRPVTTSCLVSPQDTENFVGQFLRVKNTSRSRPIPIGHLYPKLVRLLGVTIPNPGLDQERNRGGALHKLVGTSLGCRVADSGQFPDITEQLLEIKLQTSPTIDLGLVSPDSDQELADPPGTQHRDVRYAVFYGSVVDSSVRLEHVVLTTGADFFEFFQRFAGKVRNKKLQIPLPDALFR